MMLGKFLLAVIVSLLTVSTSCPLAKSFDRQQPETVVSKASIYDPSVRSVFDSLSSDGPDDLFIDDYYEGVYFSNLRENFGNNRYGSCSYVSIGMLLSFYDSYWDDSFIPEAYDATTAATFTTYPAADFAFPSFHAESPGVGFEPDADVGSLSIEEYEAYALSHEDEYFQCKLISLSQKYFGSEKFETDDGPFGMTFSEALGFMGYYLYDYRGFNTSQVVIDSCNDPVSTRSFAIEKIKSGVPVLLRAKSATLGGHAFIAYDYDSSSDEIYVHTGWRDSSSGKCLSHVSLSSTGFASLSDAFSLDVTMPASHSHNYLSTAGDAGCSCNFIFPQEIELVSGNYRDEVPTFAWKSLFKEKWYSSYEPYFDFSILNSSSEKIFEVKGIRTRNYTLTDGQWDQTLFAAQSRTYYAYVRLNSAIYPYWDDYYAKAAFTKPLGFNEIPSIGPDEYGFADAYPADDSTRNDFLSHTTSQGFRFETRRFRTGYIHNEYIVMSPKRQGFKEAFIEYRFSCAVTRIDVELAHWRPTSHELLTPSTGEASVQYYWEDGWVNKLDLLSSSTALPTNRNAHVFYKIFFDNPVYRVRFHANTFSENSNDGNRGRICIGQMAFYPSEYNFPLSGGELDYEPESWSNVENATNCYAYALNVKTNPYPNTLFYPWALQPGTSDGLGHLSDPNYLTQSFLEEMVGYDSVNYGFSFQSIGAHERCANGSYKIALAIHPGRDYHWYRQNSDGTWSHKPGPESVRNFDYSNKVVYDPGQCDRRADGGLNYTQFCGYYQVNVSSINVDIYGA